MTLFHLKKSLTDHKNERLKKYEAIIDRVQIDIYLPYYSVIGIAVENLTDIGLTATKHVAEFRRRQPERAGSIIALCTVVAVVSGSVAGMVMVATSPSAARLLAAPHLRVAIAISALALLFLVINEAQNGILSGLEAFRRRSAVQFAAGVASLPITVLSVFFFGLFGAVCGMIASQAVLVLLSYQAIQREASSAGVPIRWREGRKEIGILASFSLPTLCSGAVYVPAMWIANMIIGKYTGGYAEMGVFSAADRWRTAIAFLPMLLGGVTLPMLSSLSGESDHRRFHKLLRANAAITGLASLGIAVPIAALAPWIMRSYGSGFAEGKWVLVMLCATAVLHASYWIVGQALFSKGRVWPIFGINLGWAALLLGTVWLLREHGARGLAAAYLVADAYRLLVSLIVSGRLLTGQAHGTFARAPSAG